ncbi:MAG: MFS transporter [Verrucomicrobiota bacterium]
MSLLKTNPDSPDAEPRSGRSNLVLLLIAVVLIGSGEEMWMRFLPKYLQTLGAGVFIIGLFDALKTFLGAVYAWPGGLLSDRLGHRKALVFFNVLSVAGYVVVAFIPHWSAVLVGMFLFLAWSCLSLPATFSLIATSLTSNRHATGVAVQSVVKRLPIIVGPLAGGLLIDRYGIVTGVKYALLASIALGVATIFIQQRIREAAPVADETCNNLRRVIEQFPPALRRLLVSDILIRFCERIPAAWVVIYAMETGGITGTQVGLLTSFEMIAAIVCTIPASYYADRYGREPFVLVTFLFFTAFPLLLLPGQSFGWLSLAFVIRGLKEFGEPARKALIMGYCLPGLRGRMVGAYYLIRDLVVTIGAFLGAALWKLGPAVNFWAASALGLAGAAFYLATYKNNYAQRIAQ